MTTVTPDLLRAILPTLRSDVAAISAPKLATAFDRFAMNTPRRTAHALAQIAEESAFRPIEENLFYGAARLVEVWPGRFTPALARMVAYDPKRIAGIVYGDRLGNRGAADGWAYRGRGFIQLTGRANYAKYGEMIGYPLERLPDLLLQYGVSALVAGAYWQSHGLNEAADLGGVDVVAQITRRVNGGTNGLQHRMAFYQRAAAALGIN